MNKNQTTSPSQLSEKEKHIMGLMFETYYYEMLNKAKKYIQDRERAHDIVIANFENVARRYSIVKIENVKSFLYVSIAHEAQRARTRKKNILYTGAGHENEYKHDNSFLMQYSTFDAVRDSHFKELEKALQYCISQMTPNQSQLFNLIIEEGKSYKEIAQLTKKTVNQIKANWWCIKKKIYDAIYK